MKFQRTLPPAAAPVYMEDIVHGILALPCGNKVFVRFTNDIKHHFGVKHCFFVSSGKTALYAILKALLKIHPDKDEVLVPAFNCYSVPSAIVKAGCKVRLCDIDPHTLDFNKKQLAWELSDSKRLQCVIPTHLFGLDVDIGSVRNLIKEESIFIVEDAAQAMSSSARKFCLELAGDVGFFSLGRGKAFSTYEGGIIITNNDVIGQNLETIINEFPDYSAIQTIKLIIKTIAVTILSNPLLFGIPKSLPFLKIGETAFEHFFPILKLGLFQAGLAYNWAKKLDEFIEQRRNNTAFWALFFKEYHDYDIYSFVNSDDYIPALLRFPIVILNDKKRNFILSESERYGLGICRTYPDSLDNLVELEFFQPVKCQKSEMIARTIVTLPVHPYLTVSDRERIASLFLKIF
jgi:perosamine synthetase